MTGERVGQGETGVVCVESNHLREISKILSHKWDLTILALLAEHPLRYTEVLREVRKVDSDLTEGVLNKNLKALAANGLVRKEPIDKRRHVWNLTPHGRYLVEILSRITSIDDPESPPDEQDPDDDGES
jgi:DNA-binding HxlR family transcriptional regulator